MTRALHLRFEPRLGPFLQENALGTILLLIAIPIGLRVTAGADWAFGLAVAVVTSIVAWAVYLRRFRRKAPLWIDLTAEGIEVRERNGKTRRLPWIDVHRATHESVYGLRWRLAPALGDEMLVRDDGLNAVEWTRLSTALRIAVEAAGGEVEIETGLERFDEPTAPSEA